MKKILSIFLWLVSLSIFAQQGGMWIPSLLSGMNETEMKTLGMKMSIADIYAVNQSSIKDAIVHFNNGCTSEIISPEGLLLTNHHCGYGQIQSHSTVEKDYLQHGFWAMSKAEELPNPGVVATLIVSITDVTTLILNDTKGLNEADKQKKIQENIVKTSASFPKETWQDIRIRDFYEGNQYLLFVVETFKDIRLVGAPPSSIGKFGSDTDNWVWPRHTGDFALFRIYADANNRPAAYSTSNVPYKPKHFLPISLDGIEEGDFTMVFGFPGRTQEYLPSIAVSQIVDQLNPVKIEIRDASLKIADGFMRKDQAIKIQYAAKYASIANAWKKWIGENQGIKKANAIAVKKEFEKEFENRASKSLYANEYLSLLPEFEKLYTEIEPYSVSRDIFMEIVLRNTELLNIGFRLYQLEQLLDTKGWDAFDERKKAMLKNVESMYKSFNATVDRPTFEKLIQLYKDRNPKSLLPVVLNNADIKMLSTTLYEKSKLANAKGLESMLSVQNKKEFEKIWGKDAGYQFIRSLSKHFYEQINPEYERIQLQINALQRTYMKAQLELFPNARIFPDANSTMRVTYGKVKGYSPADAVYYNPVTYLEGVMEKYQPGDYEFDVPEKLIELHKAKDYGAYADKNGKIPVCFIATNHTTGGNSGSPALDAHGNLIGLNFDRVWEGTMSDIYYDPEICRNIMVDIRYVLFIVEKYANAKHLVDEMKLVYPKTKQKQTK